MRAVLLCAGFGTRLYPLTEDRPKSLLQVAGEPLLNYLVRELETIPLLHQVTLVANGRFYDQFCDWQRKLKSRPTLTIVNDRAGEPENRLGAIKDLQMALSAEKSDDDILVLAGDNLFDAGLEPFISFALSKRPAGSVGVYQVESRALAKKYGLIQTDSSDKITGFFEKPENPPTLLASMGVYFFPKETLSWIDCYLGEHKNLDAPGYYISWLIKQVPLFAFRFGGSWFDIGDFNSYQKANEHFEVLKKT